jgi:hypothetical protein
MGTAPFKEFVISRLNFSAFSDLYAMYPKKEMGRKLINTPPC